MTNKFRTEITNLESLKEFDFSIPTYQRPYVWGQEQIEKLLRDFYLSFDLDENSDYFVGNILTKENGEHAELIDGQQRFTTLWLTAWVISRKSKDSFLREFLMNKNGSLKMSFEIRTEVAEYFSHLTRLDQGLTSSLLNSDEIQKHPYLKNISTALATIEGLTDELIPRERLENYGNYIYRNVKFVKNTTPENINLNKLFSTINSSGVQLEQTDILKANLLKRIDKKVLYGKVWESCENMNNFFEKNARESFQIEKYKWYQLDLTNIVAFDENVFDLNPEEDHGEGQRFEPFTIDSITSMEIPSYQEEEKHQLNERESDEIYCRSIINFGQLLLHTYRIHLKAEGKEDIEGTFHVNRLLEIFKPLQETTDTEEINRFLKRLWIVRQLFDKYVIKWISDPSSKTETLELSTISRSTDTQFYTISKIPNRSPMLMLQSVLYFTGDYLRQYWLTSYLGYLFEHHNNLRPTSDELLLELEKIDNQLSLSKGITDKEASLKLLNSELSKDRDIRTELEKINGTNFEHYWFQKLEYVLFKNWPFEKTVPFLNYRITSRNSIEHIYPQHPDPNSRYQTLSTEHLDSFGNLVLLSVSQNSEYSNRSVDQKRSMFNEKNVYDTLKSYYIFHNYQGEWNEISIGRHREEMIELLERHYGY